jgi:hypothetical protein
VGDAAARYFMQRGIKSSGDEVEEEGISSGIFNTWLNAKVPVQKCLEYRIERKNGTEYSVIDHLVGHDGCEK